MRGDSRDRRRPRNRRSSGNREGHRGRVVDRRRPLNFFRGAAPNLQPPASSLRCERAARCPTYIYDADTPRVFATPRHYAYVKVAEGCDYKCSFCIIPTLRGAYRSRPSASIVQEARALAARGVKELLLISQDTTFYGIDRHERGALARLLRELNTIDGLEWIRLLYLYPTTIDDETLDGDGGVRQGLQVHRPAAAACLESGVEAHEAARHTDQVRRLAEPDSSEGPGRLSPNHVHRRASPAKRTRMSMSFVRS